MASLVLTDSSQLTSDSQHLGIPDGRRPLGRLRTRWWEWWDGPRIDMKELGVEENTWKEVVYDRIRWGQLGSNEDITEEDQLNELMKIYFRVLDKVLVRCKTKDKHSQAPICVAPPTRDMKGHQFPFAVNKAPHAFHMILESPSTKSFHHIGADFQLREVELKRLTLESDDQNVSKVVRNALIKLSETESSKTLISMFELIDEFIHEYGLLQNKDGTNDDFICKFCFVKFNADMRSRENFCCDASKQLDKVRKAWKLHDTTNTVVKLDENVFLGMLDSIIKKGAGNIPSETYIRESDKIDDKDDEFLDEKLWNVSPSENKDMRKNFTLLEQNEELPPEETSFFPNVVNETFFTKRSKNYPTDQIMKPLNTEFMSHLISIDTYKTVKKRDSKDGVSTKLNGDVKIYNTMKKGQQQSECAAELSNNMGNISLHKTKNLTNMETEIYKSSLQSIKKLGQANPVALHPNKKDAMGYGEDQSDSNLIMFAESEKRSEAKNKHAIGEKGNVKTSSPNLAFSIPMTSLTSVARKTQSARNRQKIHEGATSHVLDPTIWEQREDVSLIMQRYDSSGERKPEFGHGSNVHHGDRISQKVVKGGIISYRLSDPKYLELGWSILPSEKLMRKVVTFQTEPSKPRSVWRTNRAKSETKWYSENKLFSTFDLEGSGKVFYPDGSVAVSLTRSTSGIGRLTVLGHRDPLEKNEKISNVPILAIFDSSGNGIVFNTVGNIRASYTQKEGILLETPNGSPMKWKWPALQGFEDKFEEVLCRHESQDDPHLKDPQSLCESRTYKEAILKSKEQRENVGRNTHDSQTGPNASIHSKKRLHHLDEINYCSRGSKTSHHKVREGSTDRSLKMRLSPSMINDDLFRTHTREDISKISHEDKKEVENTTEIKKNQANGTYTPIKPITLRINEFITFKLMDQANICIDFSANKHFQRLDMGVIVNPSLTNHVDYVDPDLWEKEKIPSPFRHLLGLSPSHDRKIEGKSVLKNKSQEKKHSRQVRELSTSHLNKAVVSVENGLFDLTKSRNSGDLIPPHRTRTLMIEDPKIYNPTKTHIPVIRT
uniref:FAM194 C-terminal domain-containing protein n=1 Tax=Timema poppense TaxID=170557 RepID=A0A7R9CUI2_TIMPO|nr:unnamed protein product [Timema poppensis]